LTYGTLVCPNDDMPSVHFFQKTAMARL